MSFYAEDPYENGWGDSDNRDYQFRSNLGSVHSPSPFATSVGIPDEYRQVREHHQSVATSSQFDQELLQPLVKSGSLSSASASKIANVIYDNLVPLDDKQFFQALGLVGLELEGGNGDYATLSFRQGSLPSLPDEVVQVVTGGVIESDNEDPWLSRDANLADVHPPSQSPVVATPTQEHSDWDPLLADRSSQSLQEEDGEEVPPPQPISNSDINTYLNDLRAQFNPLADNGIQIKEIPEREGLIFKHTNYSITHNMRLGTTQPGEKKVVRRYSDFAWLLEYLLAKYPFRVIPGLPPKKFNGSSPDSHFLQSRRRGLYRFLNQLVKHPVLKHDPVVVTFLTVPTDLSVWKRQANIDPSSEFTGQKISTSFINSIWPTLGTEFLRSWHRAEQGIRKLIEVWTKLIILVERHERRQQQVANDNMRFNEMMSAFSSLDSSVYPTDDNSAYGINNAKDTPYINDSLSVMGQGFTKGSDVGIDESFVVNSDILEQMKGYLDYLYSMQELFERSKRLSANSIDQLQAKIKEKESRFAKLNTEAVDARGAQVAQLRQSIINDKQEMFNQLNRDWLIKQCCLKEFTYMQQTQFLISQVWLDWNNTRIGNMKKLVEVQEGINHEVERLMPVEHSA